MGDRSKIEWTDASWNPVTGCTKVSPGCDHCYAERITNRFGGPGAFDTVTLHPERLEVPLRWRRPRRVFVNSMSDLFHQDIEDHYIAMVFAVMGLAPQHVFQVLTKRHARMRALMGSDEFRSTVARIMLERVERGSGPPYLPEHLVIPPNGRSWWPLPNVWLGVSVEDQRWAEIRVPALLDTPARVRFLSCEPLLGPINLFARSSMDRDPGVDWVIVGGESGPQARPMHPDWARQLRDQGSGPVTAFFFKQWGEWQPVGPLYGDDEVADDARMEAVALEVMERKSVVQLERAGYVVDGHQPTDPRTWLMARVGKRRAGRELDGRTWDEMPAVG